MKEIISQVGTPIHDFTGKTIWAFFKERMISYGSIEFHSVPQLLGIPTIEQTEYNPPLKSESKLHIYYNTHIGKWCAGAGCVQKDFEECEYFYMNRMGGPQNTYEALDMLMNDEDFVSFTDQIGNGTKERLSYYLEMLDYRRR